MEDMEHDVIVVTDDEGNEKNLEVVDYFLYDGNEYAVLVEAGTDPDDEEADAYMMQVREEGEDEIFEPIPEEIFDEVSDAYLAALDEDDDEEDL